MAHLDVYRAKRDFAATREPRGAKPRTAAPQGGAFVIQKHAARRLHYDLRLEHDGVLWSWAVTRGPSLDPADKRLAVHVEDHPFEYRNFEGTIPKGQYGGGSVIIWDEGRWQPEGDPAAAMKKGHISFELQGQKLHGRWHLVRLEPRAGEKRDNWLLMKGEDEAARPDEDILELRPESIRSGRTVEQVGAGATAPAADHAKEKAARKPPAARRATSPAHTSPPPPGFVAPCLATLAVKPPVGDQWLHEVKFDGYRLEARIEHGAARLLTRTGLDWSRRFGARIPAALLALPCQSALIDGEIVVLADNGVSSFSALQAALSEGRTGAMVYFVFDLLYLDGEDLRSEPLLARKERLESLLHGADPNGALRISEHFVEPGATLLRHACRMGLEGVVSKRAGAPYRSGRGGDWIKSKCTQRQEFVIVGYVPSKAAGRELASLVLGYHEGEKLRPAGRVGTGFSGKIAAELMRKLVPIKAPGSAFEGAAGKEKGVVWVRPELVAEVAFGAWTADGILRHASFQGLREDKPAEEVVAETAEALAPAVQAQGAPTGRKDLTSSVKLTHPDKLLWPEAGVSKGQLLDYYQVVWPHMRALVTDRPLALVRAPNGVGGQHFFQKHASPGMPGAIGVTKDPASGDDLLSISGFDGIAALVQFGVVEIHIWGARVGAIETPDQLVFDLDPDAGLGVEKVRVAALAIRDRLRELGLTSFPKTSGGKGFHIVVPLAPQARWDRVKAFAHAFAKAMEQIDPQAYTATLSKVARKGRIFIDYLRNARGATAVAPYSARANAAAKVSMPISWEMLEKGAAPGDFDLLGILSGKQAPSDAWAAYASAAKPLPAGD